MAQENVRHTIYIDGNTVRMEDVYITPPQPFTEQKRKINKRIAAQEHPAGISFLSLAGIIAATVITLILCIDYVQLQSDIRVSLNTINSMEEELANLTAENKALEKQVGSYIDLNYVYQVATEELGMCYPTEEQVVYYESTASEYVRQYGAISENNIMMSDNIFGYFKR